MAEKSSAGDLPAYLAAAKPVPQTVRAPWYKTIAPAYLGVMLWFVFWQDLASGGLKTACPAGGMLGQGLWPALFGLVVAALICHFAFYLAPGMLGMRTGLPLYVVGTSTYGATGGLLMPGFLMGLLQFGWLAVNAAAVSGILCTSFGLKEVKIEWLGIEGWHSAIAAIFVIFAAFVGLKGIQYVGRVGTYLPLIPVILLIILLAKTCGGLGSFQVKKDFLGARPAADKEHGDPLAKGPAQKPAGPVAKANAAVAEPKEPFVEEAAKPSPASARMTTPLDAWKIFEILGIYVVGFFATAGAAGVDIAMGSRTPRDVHLGGLMGILVPTVLAGGVTIVIIAGAYGGGLIQHNFLGSKIYMNPVGFMSDVMGAKFTKYAMVALAVSSFPGACFSSFIAANSFKTTMPRINPFLSVGCGALAAIILAITGWADRVAFIFGVIGASFGPVCGAMLADYWIAGSKWSGPRAGFNPAGWISWIAGFAVGAFDLVAGLLAQTDWGLKMFPHLTAYHDPTYSYIFMPPVTAFIVGFGLYVLLAAFGLRTRKLEMPAAAPG